jgi:hypothetical protein
MGLNGLVMTWERSSRSSHRQPGGWTECQIDRLRDFNLATDNTGLSRRHGPAQQYVSPTESRATAPQDRAMAGWIENEP